MPKITSKYQLSTSKPLLSNSKLLLSATKYQRNNTTMLSNYSTLMWSDSTFICNGIFYLVNASCSAPYAISLQSKELWGGVILEKGTNEKLAIAELQYGYEVSRLCTAGLIKKQNKRFKIKQNDVK